MHYFAKRKKIKQCMILIFLLPTLGLFFSSSTLFKKKPSKKYERKEPPSLTPKKPLEKPSNKLVIEKIAKICCKEDPATGELVIVKYHSPESRIERTETKIGGKEIIYYRDGFVGPFK